MPPKGKGKKKVKDINWADDEHFSKERSMVYIEHTTECPIFQVKADEFLTFVQQSIPERQFQMVRNNNGRVPPREGAFEIEFSQNARTSKHCLWTGIERGPPRRDKFPPNPQELLSEIYKILKKFYPDNIINPEDDEDDEMPPEDMY